jgi:predicted transcriptional regulator
MKVAVSIPDPIFEAADKLAKQRDIPRSQIFAEALAAYLELRNAESVTALLDEIYGQHPSAVDEGLSRAQAKSVIHEAR